MEAREMEPNYVNSRIGEKIKDLRNKNGLTQQELADRAELTKGYISQLERGQVAPSVVTLLDLSVSERHLLNFSKRRKRNMSYIPKVLFLRKLMKWATVSNGSCPMHSRIRWNHFW